MLLSKFGEGRGGEGGSFVAWLEEGGKSLSFSLFLCLRSGFEGSYGKW